MTRLTDKEIKLWLDKGMCPYCHVPLKKDTRFTDGEWGMPITSYKIKVCPECEMTVGDEY